MILGESGISVVISAETASYLEKLDQGRAMSRLRMLLRDGRHQRVSSELLELRRAAMSYDPGALPVETEVGSPETEVAEDLGCGELGVAQAADLLGISMRAVRMACESGRLVAEKPRGRWLTTTTAVKDFRAARTAEANGTRGQ